MTNITLTFLFPCISSSRRINDANMKPYMYYLFIKFFNCVFIGGLTGIGIHIMQLPPPPFIQKNAQSKQTMAIFVHELKIDF